MCDHHHISPNCKSIGLIDYRDVWREDLVYPIPNVAGQKDGWKNVFFNKPADVGQVRRVANSIPIESASLNVESDKPNGSTAFRKRARAKAMTNEVVRGLMSVRMRGHKSAMWSSYRKSLSCSATVAVEDGYLVSRYCKQRWCLVCNRIRTAKLISQYQPLVKAWSDVQLVTLSVQNVKRDDLKDRLDEMHRIFGLCVKQIRRDGMAFKAVRKLECTFNDGSGANDSKKDWSGTFHPHYHVIIESEVVAKRFVELWKDRCKKAKIPVSDLAQDVRKLELDQDAIKACEDVGKRAEMRRNSFIEVFKYFTKVLPKDVERADFGSLDHIFRAMYQRRVIQPYGFKIPKPLVDPDSDPDEIWTVTVKTISVRTVADNLEDGDLFEWIQSKTDWIGTHRLDGQPLTGYRPGLKFRAYLDELREVIDKQIEEATIKSELVRDENMIVRDNQSESGQEDASYWREFDRRRGLSTDLSSRFGQLQNWFDRRE